MSKDATTKNPTGAGSPQKTYLLLYNTAMAAGWATVLGRAAIHLLRGGPSTTVYDAVAVPLVLFQTGAAAEVVHAMIGLVRSPVGTTLLQLLSRLLVLYGAVRIGETPARRDPAFLQMLIAWALSEVIRYTFYGANLLGKATGWLTWLRYSAFMLLYPLGISGEAMCLYKAMDFIRENKPWTVELPNKMNFTFSWYNGVWVLLGIYPIGSYVMYTYMLSQRRKVLGKNAAAAKAKAE
ncbi:unnamed protein product [Phytomonas sp. EM1]|nr:unnamed protein product [Phytomonas sp. EM1]|eukprot:CCW64440.1 unnamed protein product [Phytomonas sp. isolate EM1]